VGRVIIDSLSSEAEKEIFLISLRCHHSARAGSTRIISGRDFDDALDASMRSMPEEGCVIDTASRWNPERQDWDDLSVPFILS